MMRTAILACLVVALQTPTFADEPKGPLIGFAASRSWSDASGTFKVDAELVWADQEAVKLKTAGRVVTVPLAKLSEGDQTFINGFLQAESALNMSSGAPPADNPNPFAGGVPASEASAAASSATSSSGESASGLTADGEIVKRETTVQGMRPISVSPGKEFWEVPKLHSFPPVRFNEVVIPTKIRKPFFSSFQMLAAGKTANVVFNVYQQRGRDPEYTELSAVNVTTGKLTDVLKLDQPWKVISISADGGLIAAVRIVGFDKGSDIAIMRVTDSGIKPEFQFTAGGGSWDEVRFAKFLPGGRLLTISQKHNLTVWQLGDGPVRAIARGNSGGQLSAEFSPAGEMMAMIAGNSIAMIDTVNFKLTGYISRDEKPLQLAFSPDGKSLAAFHPFNISIYSMETGQPMVSFPVSEKSVSGPFLWSGNYLLVGSVLYDPEKKMPLWTYKGKDQRTTLGNYLFSGFASDKQSTLVVSEFPHVGAKSSFDGVSSDSIYCIAPGDSVSVDYQLAGVPGNLQQDIKNAVEEKIKELGWRLGASSDNKVVVSLTQGEAKTEEYYKSRGFGPRFFPPGMRPSGPSEKVNYRPWLHTFTVNSAGKQVHKVVRNYGAPQSISSKEGESTQQAVDRYCRPTPAFFKGLVIPPHLLKPEYQGGLGSSTITTSGIQ